MCVTTPDSIVTQDDLAAAPVCRTSGQYTPSAKTRCSGDNAIAPGYYLVSDVLYMLRC
jgi:hypothetical protein